MAKAKVVILAEKHNLMRRDGLWLTTGGRVVKPGWGEYARADFSDILLLDEHEIEAGISLDEFSRRWAVAKRKWRRRNSWAVPKVKARR